MSQPDQQFYAAGGMNEQQLWQISNALYSYCRVMRVPKLGAIPVVVTVLEGLSIALILFALGEELSTALLIGAPVSAVFAILCVILYRFRSGASKRLNAYLAVDGGQRMYMDFAAAQPYADDQFRVGRFFLFIKNGAVVRLDSIADVVRVISHYRMVPTGVFLSVKVKDENGSMACPLCKVHLMKAEAEIFEIRNVLLQRPW